VHDKTVWVIPKERFLFESFTVISSVHCIKTGQTKLFQVFPAFIISDWHVAPPVKFKNMRLSVHLFTFAYFFFKYIKLQGEHYNFKYSLVFTLTLHLLKEKPIKGEQVNTW
jgi:hypothetical protein